VILSHRASHGEDVVSVFDCRGATCRDKRNCCGSVERRRIAAATMAMGKGFRVYEKLDSPKPHSIILEQRSRKETLLFESQAIAVLCK